MKISIVIPAHNEEMNIKSMINLLKKILGRNIYEIIIVDDCSTDSTQSVLRNIQKHYKKLKPVFRRGEKGVGRAIRAGLSKVGRDSQYTLLLDCDFIKNEKDIKKVISAINGNDGVIGSRFINEGVIVNYPFPKKFVNRVYHLLARVFIDREIHDVTNNFKFYKSDVIKKIFPLLISDGFSINAEIGIYPFILGYNIKQVPVSWIGRTFSMGKSSFRVLEVGPGYLKMFINAVRLKYFLLHSR